MEDFFEIGSCFVFLDALQLSGKLVTLEKFLDEERAQRERLNADTPLIYVHISISRFLIDIMGIDISFARAGRESTDTIRRALKKIGEKMEDDTIRRVRRVLSRMEPPGKGAKVEASFRKIFFALLHRRKGQGEKTIDELKDEIRLGLNVDKPLLDDIFAEYQKRIENL